MTAKEMFKYDNYDLIVEENGNLKYFKKDDFGNKKVIEFIEYGDFQVVNVYWENANGEKLPYSVTLRSETVLAINKQIEELEW